MAVGTLGLIASILGSTALGAGVGALGAKNANTNGMAYRGLGSSLFNQEEIALEDYQRDLAKQQINNEFTAQQNALQREFNAVEAEKARNWEEKMSNTVYQRAQADLQKAGINPILAYSSSASTPQGAVASGSSAGASGSSAHYSNTNDPAMQIISTLAQIGMTYLAGRLGQFKTVKSIK